VSTAVAPPRALIHWLSTHVACSPPPSEAPPVVFLPVAFLDTLRSNCISTCDFTHPLQNDTCPPKFPFFQVRAAFPFLLNAVGPPRLVNPPKNGHQRVFFSYNIPSRRLFFANVTSDGWRNRPVDFPIPFFSLGVAESGCYSFLLNSNAFCRRAFLPRHGTLPGLIQCPFFNCVAGLKVPLRSQVAVSPANTRLRHSSLRKFSCHRSYLSYASVFFGSLFPVLRDEAICRRSFSCSVEWDIAPTKVNHIKIWGFQQPITGWGLVFLIFFFIPPHVLFFFFSV